VTTTCSASPVLEDDLFVAHIQREAFVICDLAVILSMTVFSVNDR
jgi:hypothetical protein